MDRFVKDLKKAGIFNTVLIIIVLVLEVLGLLVMSAFSSDRLLNILNIIALLCGLFYIFTGYRKGSAKFFKLFMGIYAFVSAYDAITDCIYSIKIGLKFVNVIDIVMNFLAALCVIILAISKDLGKKRSMFLAELNAALTITSDVIIGIFVCKDFLVYADIYLGDILLSCLALLFIIAKYANKEARGAK